MFRLLFTLSLTALGVAIGYDPIIKRAPAAIVATAEPRDYASDLAAWLEADAAWDAWNVANDARNAALAEHAQYLADVSAAKLAVPPTFFDALEVMEPICFLSAWPWGPFAYAGNVTPWLTGPDDAALPATLANYHVNIRAKVTAAGLDPTTWDAHVTACTYLTNLRLAPPPPLPPDPGPMPPDPGPMPQPPPAVAASYVADPAGYVVVATGQRVNVSGAPPRVLNHLLKNVMKPGEIADLVVADFPRIDVKDVLQRPKGGSPVTLRGRKDAAGKRPKILRNVPPSGSSDSIWLGPNTHGVHFESLDIETGVQYGVELSWHPHDDIAFKDCRIFGYFDPTDANTRGTNNGVPDGDFGVGDPSVSGMSWGQVSNLLVEDLEVFGSEQEHGFYWRNRQGPATLRNVYIHDCSRTGLQDVSRVGEGPEGKGDVLIEGCTFRNLNFEDSGGGQALTCRGGNKAATWTLRNVLIEQGCDPNVKSKWRDITTGCVVFDNGSSGSYAGGTGKVIFDGVTCRMGLVNPGGANGSRRPNVMLKVVGVADFRKVSIENGRLAQEHALEITTGVGDVYWNDAECEIVFGKVLYNGVEYQNEAAWIAAKDPDGDGKLAE